MITAFRLGTRSCRRLPSRPSCHARCFSDAVGHPANRVQVYVSRSRDPYLNLSIEHYLLQKSPPDAVVLFLYTNRPSVVIGRNQNPWLEVNLGAIGRPGLLASSSDRDAEDAVSLVRRRSGGGTVFHDEGNVNYSVICPPADFDRNKHAEMVVRALHDLGVRTTRVNERHDIVLDVERSGETQVYKVSGSAYKLTRLRSLHHGTCLLSSPNLGAVSQFLHSPAEPFIKARGVASFRSPIRNVEVRNNDFEEAVVAEFCSMYGIVDAVDITNSDAQQVPDVMKGCDELKSSDWIYTQTPQFTFSSHQSDEDPRTRPGLPDYLPNDFRLSFTARHGQIIQAESESVESSPLESTTIHRVHNWKTLTGDAAGRWLNELFGIRD